MPETASFRFAPPDAIPPEALHRVLVIKLRHHGDVLLTSPLFTALKTLAPHAELDALVYQDTQDMLSGHPALHTLHTIDRQWKHLGPWGQCQAEWGLIRTLRQRRYDLVIHLTEHRRGGWLTRLLQPRWAIAPEANQGRWFDRAFTHRYPVVGGNARHTVQIHLDALRRLGLHPESPPPLTLACDAASQQRVQALLASHQLAPGGFLLIHPASRWLFKCWPVERMRQLIQRLQADGQRIVLTGAPDPQEQAMLAAICAGLPRPVLNLQGQLSLKELAALIGQARLFIGMDSAPMHMAAAMQTPTVAFFGPSGEGEWGPWLVPHRIVRSDHPCRPCGKDGCGGGKRSECLEVLSVNTAYDAIADLLAATR